MGERGRVDADFVGARTKHRVHVVDGPDAAAGDQLENVRADHENEDEDQGNDEEERARYCAHSGCSMNA